VVPRGFLGFGTPATYGPAVGLRGLPKPPPATALQELMQSRSSTLAASAVAQAGMVVAGPAPPFIFVRGELQPPGTTARGAAAGAAFDPFEVAPGVYPYAETVNASFQLDGPEEFGGVVFFAVDSRFSNPETFYARGQPFEEALWALSLFADSPVSDPSQLQVDFLVNPQARALGVFNPSLTDAQLTAAVRAAITVSDGVASLTNFSLFPTGTTLTVRSIDGTIRFGEGVNAGITSPAVPEPGSLALLSVGGLVALGARRFHRGRARAAVSVTYSPAR